MIRYMRSFSGILFLIFTLNACSVSYPQVTVKDWFGVNTFLGGKKYGHGWPPETLLADARVKRFFLANENTSRQENVFHLFRSINGWGWEESLVDYKSQNQTTIITLLGGFGHQTMDGKMGAKMPVNIDADPTDPASYYTLSRLCYNMAARWGKNKEAQINNNELANTNNPLFSITPDNPLYPGWETLPEAGKNLVDYIEILNEWDNTWSGSSVTFTAESYAVCLKVCYDAIKSADPDMKVMMGALHKMNIPLIESVKAQWTLKGYGAWPDDLYINYHRYMHNGLSGGIRTGGTIPEVSPYGVFNQVSEMDALGVPWFVTEYGYDADSASMQSAPILKESDGKEMSLEKSKGVLIVRSTLLYAISQNCKASVFYHIRNESNERKGWLYTSTGIYSREYIPQTGSVYTPTEALQPIQEFLDNVGDCELPARLISNKSPYKVVFKKGNKKVICTWTDNGPVEYTTE